MVFDCTCAWWAASVGFDKRNLMVAHKDEPRIMTQQSSSQCTNLRSLVTFEREIAAVALVHIIGKTVSAHVLQ